MTEPRAQMGACPIAAARLTAGGAPASPALYSNPPSPPAEGSPEDALRTLPLAPGAVPGEPFNLSWPKGHLWPNRKAHWAVLAKHRKAAKAEAWASAVDGGWWKFAVKAGADRVRVALEFCPPDMRRRDDDNMVAAMKAAIDGIAEAIGIDDSAFEIVPTRGECIKGGLVRVSITAI